MTEPEAQATDSGDGGLSVRVGDVVRNLRAGDVLRLGRHSSGTEEANRLDLEAATKWVHRNHLQIEVERDHWTARSLGRHHGFKVSDVDGLSRLFIGPGEAAQVWFHRAKVEVDRGPDAPPLLVEVSMSRGPSVARQSFAPAARLHDPFATVGKDVFQTHGKDGAPYRWFLVLVALCEPRLLLPPQSRIPTNREVRRRLRAAGHEWLVNVENIDKVHLPTIRNKLGIGPGEVERVRDAVVERALERSLVTRNHLAELDRP